MGHAFMADPQATAAQWGCIVSAPRFIKTLYRIREYGGQEGESFGRFGYPLWITAR